MAEVMFELLRWRGLQPASAHKRGGTPNQRITMITIIRATCRSLSSCEAAVNGKHSSGTNRMLPTLGQRGLLFARFSFSVSPCRS